MWGEFDTEFIFQLFSPLSGFSQLLKCVIHWKGAHPCRKVAEKGKGKSTFSLMHKLPLWGETTFHSLMKRETGEHYLLFFLHSLSWGRSFPWFVIKKPLGFSHPAMQVCSHGSRHLLIFGNTLLPPHPCLGTWGQGLNRCWETSGLGCSLSLLSWNCSKWPGAWTLLKPSVYFLMRPWDSK